jgi:hypothetical protein
MRSIGFFGLSGDGLNQSQSMQLIEEGLDVGCDPLGVDVLERLGDFVGNRVRVAPAVERSPDDGAEVVQFDQLSALSIDQHGPLVEQVV